MKADRTMDEIAASFLRLADTQPISRITVADIVKECGKNRKTFYYHFSGKEQLVIWILRRDLAELLEEAFDAHKLLYLDPPAPDDDPLLSSTKQFPYYVHNESGFCMLDHSAFFVALARAFDKNRSVYAQSVSSQWTNPLQQHLHALYVPALKQDISFMLGTRHLGKRQIDFLADFYAIAFIGTFIQAVRAPEDTSVSKAIAPQGNMIHEALRREIDERRLERML